MSKLQERLVNAYSTLVLAGVREIEEVPENLRAYVEIKIAEREIEVLG
jgi:hypothetical protein